MKNNYKVLTWKYDRYGYKVALIDRQISFCSYVVAWCFDPDRMEWGQGHYFDSLEEARKYYRNNY